MAGFNVRNRFNTGTYPLGFGQGGMSGFSGIYSPFAMGARGFRSLGDTASQAPNPMPAPQAAPSPQSPIDINALLTLLTQMMGTSRGPVQTPFTPPAQLPRTDRTAVGQPVDDGPGRSVPRNQKIEKQTMGPSNFDNFASIAGTYPNDHFERLRAGQILGSNRSGQQGYFDPNTGQFFPMPKGYGITPQPGRRSDEGKANAGTGGGVTNAPVIRITEAEARSLASRPEMAKLVQALIELEKRGGLVVMSGMGQRPTLVEDMQAGLQAAGIPVGQPGHDITSGSTVVPEGQTATVNPIIEQPAQPATQYPIPPITTTTPVKTPPPPEAPPVPQTGPVPRQLAPIIPPPAEQELPPPPTPENIVQPPYQPPVENTVVPQTNQIVDRWGNPTTIEALMGSPPIQSVESITSQRSGGLQTEFAPGFGGQTQTPSVETVQSQRSGGLQTEFAPGFAPAESVPSGDFTGSTRRPGLQTEFAPGFGDLYSPPGSSYMDPSFGLPFNDPTVAQQPRTPDDDFTYQLDPNLITA